ncbi:hypothetical protein ZWY2020_022322 [Hordeum vulgare]|nr:hypothetical protein ZWY2020_022322 [Hordeum vulgare]
MEPLENPSKMEPMQVSGDPCITLARKINSATRQDHRGKAKAAKEKKLKKRLTTGGPPGGDGPGGHGGWCVRGERRKTDGRTSQMVSWPEPYKHPYYYIAK